MTLKQIKKAHGVKAKLVHRTNYSTIIKIEKSLITLYFKNYHTSPHTGTSNPTENFQAISQKSGQKFEAVAKMKLLETNSVFSELTKKLNSIYEH